MTDKQILILQIKNWLEKNENLIFLDKDLAEARRLLEDCFDLLN